MKTVAYGCGYVPPEWIAAHGLVPRRVCPSLASCRWALGEGQCPYARALGAAIEQEDAIDAAVFTTLCAQMRQSAEALSQRCAKPVFVLNLPATWRGAGSAGYYRDELVRLGRFLVRCGGVEPGPEELADRLLAYDHARAQLREQAPHLGGGAVLDAIYQLHATGRFDPPALSARSIHASGPTAGARASQPACSPAMAGASGRVRLAVLGGPVVQEELSLYELIGQAGATVALEASSSGERSLAGPMDRRRLREDPLAELTAAYFGTIPHPFRRPNTGLYDWLSEQLPRRAVRGIVLRRYVWCDLWHAELARLRSTLAVPVLDLDVCAQGNTRERTAGRVGAFVEMLR